MIVRAVAAALLALALMAAPVRACDLSPGSRPDGLAAYVALAEACLARPPAPAHFDEAAEAEFLERVNGERVSRGLAPLLPSRALRVPARFHSLDQVWNGVYGHDGAGGRNLSDRIAALDRQLVYRSARENVAYAGGDYDPREVAEMLHNGLMASPGHRTNTLAPDITHAGIGVARVHDQFVVTLVFVGEVGRFDTGIPAEANWPELAALQISLEDWRFRRPALQAASGETLEGAEARAYSGAARLLIRGERDTGPGRYQFIYLSGPLVELVQPTNISAR